MSRRTKASLTDTSTGAGEGCQEHARRLIHVLTGDEEGVTETGKENHHNGTKRWVVICYKSQVRM